MLVGDFNVEPTKIPCLAKGVSAWLWVDLEASWALASGAQPAPTCKRALRLLALISFCGGPVPTRGLVLGRGSALFRVGRLGGSQGAEGLV